MGLGLDVGLECATKEYLVGARVGAGVRGWGSG